MEDAVENCYIDFNNNSLDCDQNLVVDATTMIAFTYSRSTCNCLYNQPQNYLSTYIGEGNYMASSIFIWIITEALSIGITTFTVLTLSRINRKEKSGWLFLKPNILKSFGVASFCIFFFTFVIYYLNLPIYYRFYNQGVVVFYFFWKFLGFLMVFDRLYSKIWLEWKLRF